LLNIFAKNEKTDLTPKERRVLKTCPGRHRQELQECNRVEMNKRKPIAGQRMIENARQALAFANSKQDHGCEVHVPDNIDVNAVDACQFEQPALFGRYAVASRRHLRSRRRICATGYEKLQR
jgi:hypothetical protein